MVPYYASEIDNDLLDPEEKLNMIFSELYTRAQALIRALFSCEMKCKILNSNELVELLYIAYNRDESEIYGVEKAIQDIEKINIHKGMGYNELIGKAFAYYDTLKEVDPTLVMNRDKYKMAEFIADLIYQNEDMNINDVMNRATQYIMDTYEAEQKRYNSTAQRLGQRITPDIPNRMR